MPALEQSILLIADPDETAEILEILASAGRFDVITGDGSDETLVIYEQARPDVVILCASLEHGDAQALASAMRDAPHGSVVKLVLIGERHGPIRNALDASHFAVDRFLAQPLSPKALIFAVHNCLRAAAAARAAAQPSSGELAQKMELAMNQAIDELVRDAMQALPKARRPRATLVGTPPPPITSSGTGAATEPSITEHGQSLHAFAEPSITNHGQSPHVLVVADTQADAPRRDTAGIPLLELVEAASVASQADSPTDAALPSDNDRDPADAPTVDETATIISERRQSIISERSQSAISERNQSVIDGRGQSVPPATEQHPEPSGGAFARELRRKMSVMAERLFPGQRANAQVDVGPSRDHSAEIDLTALSMDTQIGDTHVGVDSDDDDAFQGLMPTTPFLRTAPPENAAEPSPAVPSLTADSSLDASVQASVTELEWVEEELPDTGSIRRGRSDAGILIEQMYRRRFTGRVSFYQGEAEKEILFDGGRPIFASSSLAHDRMGELLFREGKITAEQYEQVKAIVAASGRRMGEVLIELGWLKRRELLPVVRQHIEDIVYSLFAWESGTYRVTAGEFAAEERIRISRHPAAMLLEGVRRKLDLDTLIALIGKPESIIEITHDRRLKSVMSVADLSPAERKVIASFDGERTIAAVQESASIELVEVYQLAYGLIVWGAARSLRRGDAARNMAADGPIAIDEASAGGANELAIDRQRVLAKYSLVTEADYFTLLGVRRDATSFEIRRAYEAARRDYASESFPPELHRELGREIAEINELLDEAYRVLRDDGLRALYLANLCD